MPRLYVYVSNESRYIVLAILNILYCYIVFVGSLEQPYTGLAVILARRVNLTAI